MDVSERAARAKRSPIGERVLVLAPTLDDAALTRTTLGEAGLTCHVCADLGELCGKMREGAGALLLTEKALRRRVEELEVVRADGTRVSLYEYASPLFDESGRVRGCLGAFVDISDRKRTEDALRREQELLQRIIDTIPVMITMYQPDTQVLRLNREFERVVGWSARDTAGASLMERCYPDPGCDGASGSSTSRRCACPRTADGRDGGAKPGLRLAGIRAPRGPPANRGDVPGGQ